MTSSGTIASARALAQRKAWRQAYELLLAAQRSGKLTGEDLELLAVTAFLVGEDDGSAQAWEEAQRAYLAEGEVARAARACFWLGFGLLRRGQLSVGGGWLARAARLVEQCGQDCVESGYLLVAGALAAIGRGDFAAARDGFRDAAAIGARFGDIDLLMLARHGEGRALLRLGDLDRGLALLDEAMVGVTTDDVSPVIAGQIYCSVIEACHEVLDWQRAREWTAALHGWCATQPELVPYRGQCLVHRAQILELHGDWDAALDEARSACTRLAEPPGQPALGMALHQLGELHRLRGRHTDAETAYLQAAELGHDPQPGLALLRLAQGRVDEARGAVRRALEEPHEQGARARLLAAAVEIHLPGDLPGARRAADELSELAMSIGTPCARALSLGASAAVGLADGDAASAAALLRPALDIWTQLEAPYEIARVRTMMAQACRLLGDHDAARVEDAAAAAVRRRLGLEPPVPGAGQAAEPHAAGLTARELDVLELVARGCSNREIAGALVISEHTVARHVQNIFGKIDVTSRTAAAAFAFAHHLVRSPGED
jgi:DNA-binding CsgD family transcriptional regulator